MLTYEEAGVSVETGDSFASWIGSVAPQATGFAGLYPFGDHYLVGCTDGVGTKLKIAFILDQHETVGIDLVAMCVNDLITVGAKPLFFLDYLATGKLQTDQAKKVLTGILEGCKQAGCALLGGETAEMPGFYKENEYDLAGFSVGAVKKEELVDGKTIQPGDLLVGFPSSGLHSNGFSLVRHIYEQKGETFTSDLLTPTKIYTSELAGLSFKGAAHITGGGLHANISRVIPEPYSIQIDHSSWEVPPIFQSLREMGGVAMEEMRKTFNMGIGMVVIVDRDSVPESGIVIGEVTP